MSRPEIPSFLLLATLAAGCGSTDKAAANDTGSGGSGDTVLPDCETRFRYQSTSAEPLSAVRIAGTFNGWDPDAQDLEEVSPGVWEVSIELPPGPHAYKFVEVIQWSQDEHQAWVCDPEAELIHCEDGYKEPWDSQFAHVCESGRESACNSMIVVPDCRLPQVEVETLDIDRSVGRVSVTAAATAGGAGGPLVNGTATLDGSRVEGAWTGTGFSVDVDGLASGRHTLRLQATDADGNQSKEVYVPFWTDAAGDDAWREGSVYFAFVDRFMNGDVSLDGGEGATLPIGDYQGGDLQGVTDMVDYLDELGVRTIWLSNPQDNAEGDWAGDCDETYAGYHAYWPDQARAVEENFGDDAALRTLIDEAHARGMRVIMDWVANHVHEDHPYATDHPEWFHPLAVCKDSVGGQSNWDRIPESCWFAPYLPDIDYSNEDALHTMVDDALWWAKTYELDGFRVDAVKHMPHSVVWNLEARIRAEIEHTAAGGDEQFWTVGETFDGYDKIVEYIHQEDSLGLDGQFDFPLYYSLQGGFGSATSSLSDVSGTAATSRERYGDALMSSFLGNHDVMRFVSEGLEGYVSACDQGTGDVYQASPASDWFIYQRMKLAWTFLYTQADVPLIYYGDEFGMPGYTDPDNRQPMWWYTGELEPGVDVDTVIGRLETEPGNVLRHVRALGQARRAHPELWRGEAVEWWVEPAEFPTTLAYARKDPQTGGESITIINRDGSDRTLTNGVAYAGLTPGAVFEDILTGETFTASGDSLSVFVPGHASRVLVKQ